MYLMDFARVSKEKLEMILSKIEVPKKMVLGVYKENIEKSTLSDTLMDIENDILEPVLNETMSDNENFIIKEEFISNPNFKDTPFYLSRSTILVYIGVHFIPATSKGSTDIISESDFANLLGINIKTLKRNYEILQALNLVHTAKESKGAVSFKIINYEQAFEKGGKGTFNMTTSFLDKLKNLKKDELKLALKLSCIDVSYKSKFKNSNARIKIKECFKIFAGGKQYKKYFIDTVLKLQEFIGLTRTGGEDIKEYNKKDYNLWLKVSDSINFSIVENETYKYNYDILKKVIEDKFYALKNMKAFVKEVSNLTHIYGLSSIVDALEILPEYVADDSIGMLRELVRENYKFEIGYYS